MPTRAAAAPAAKPGRDHRVDALRGAALLMMFADHIPQNILNRLTIRNLGFADAAEIFVLLAGFASMLAYGGAFRREGWSVGLRRLGRRVVRLYVFQMLMMITTLLMILFWRQHHTVPVDFLEPELAHGFDSLWRVFSMQALPGNLNILPLYMVLLLAFPLIYTALRLSAPLALAVSAALWALINLDPAINLPNWLDPDGWYFDPFAWQFLFTLGAWSASATRSTGGDMPRRAWAVAACWLYLAFSAVQSFPWEQWGLPKLSPLPIDPPLKTPLSPLRLIDVLSIFYLVQSSALMRRFAAVPAGQVLAVFGRHSLEVFSLGTVLDLVGRLAMTTYGTGLLMQIAVNVVGIGTLYLVATALDRRKQRKKQQKAATA
ncbi:OpgC domain-containing protein [Acetobacteraceae bacterium KSS8]|uniref:OpgC domain-containing protein n=1 Tax=Endosaccharibacter trunci TaxID=2812733 RepID=A0ABT1WA01_9PROT|nr:OpgC domain-containing protein [Acetobacteraceae bacterium KSS8]